MMKFLSNRILPLVSLAVSAFCISSCTNVDPFFANDMVPPEQLMESRIDSSFNVRTSIFNLDSIPTSNIGYEVTIGSYISPVVGRVDIGMFTNYVPLGFKDVTFFGTDPTIDSMTLGMTFISSLGDSVAGLHIDVYEVLGHTFSVDSTYYSNFDMTPYLSPQPLLSFDVTTPEVIVKKLPMEFAERHLINTPNNTNPYYSDTAFIALFNGLYFKATSVTSGQGMLVSMDLSQSIMSLFYHNKNAEPDTAIQKMLFMGDLVFENTNLQTVEYDYSYADQAAGGINPDFIGDTTLSTEFGYTAGFGGLGTKLHIPLDELQTLQSKVRAQGYSNIGIHKAELIFETVNPGAARFNTVFNRMTLYFSLLDRMFLPEYNPILEANSITTGYTSWIDGNLNRSTGTYNLDITSYIQRLIKGSFSQTELEMLPEYAANNSMGYSWIYGSGSSKPPKLIITYTMLK